MGRPAGKQSCCSDPLQPSSGMGLRHKEEKIKPREWFFFFFLKLEQMPAEFLCGRNGWLDLLLFCTGREKVFWTCWESILYLKIWVCVPMHAAHAHLFPIAKSTYIYLWKGFSQCFLAFDRFKIRLAKSLCVSLTQGFEICWLSLKVKSGASQFWLVDGGKPVLNGFEWF